MKYYIAKLNFLTNKMYLGYDAVIVKEKNLTIRRNNFSVFELVKHFN